MGDVYKTHRDRRISEMAERIRKSRIKKKRKVTISNNLSNRQGKISTDKA